MGFFGLFNKENGPSKEEMGVDTSYSHSAEQSAEDMALKNQALENLSNEAGVVQGDSGDIETEMARLQMKQANTVNSTEASAAPLESLSDNASTIEHAPEGSLTQESVAQEMAAGGVNIITESQVASTGMESSPAVEAAPEAPTVESADLIADPSQLEQAISQESTPASSQESEEPVA